MSPLASALTGVRGERVALCDVSVSAVLRDLLSEVTVCQTYRNDEDVNIEAVYTFPLPLDAVLLELRVDIGGRVLNGVVVEKKAAEEAYEDAVAAGDAAVMLEAIEPGLYTMNVGNLLPGETATITFSYAIVYRWAGDWLRVFLPTTIAPRFGASPHGPHQAPEFSLTVENQFSLQVEIFGSLREAQFVCPSHGVTLAKSAEKLVISLKQAKAAMDRDVILNVKAPQAAHSFALWGSDGDGATAVASFQPLFPGLRQPRALDLVIVIDCSGSMQGDSIAQARQALEGILNALQPHDRVTLVAFGNTTSALSDGLLPCTETNLGQARRFAANLQANMGGTEIGQALQAAYAAASASESADIFLVTDGEVSSWEAVMVEAKRSGRRIFTVGVGSAVSEAFVRGLAAATGGECELVSPREGMADRVIRHFERMRAPRAKRAAVHWPEGARDLAPATLGAVFEGDTVTACARFNRPSVAGGVVLEIETESGEVFRQELPMAMAPESGDRVSTVARLAASARLKALDRGAALDTALRYRLVSPWTNWLVVAARPEGEQAEGIPAIRKVPQTLAAGWGGVGMAACLSISALRAPEPDVAEPFRRLLALIENEPAILDPQRARRLLEEAGLMSEFGRLLAEAHDLGLSVDAIAATVLAELLGGPLREFLPTGAQRAVESLQMHAERMMHVIDEMERHAHGLLRVTEDAIASELLGPGQVRPIHELLMHLERCRELLSHLQGLARKWAAEIQDIKRHHDRRSATRHGANDE
jgi:Ca-activated chloride channel family protein